MRRDWLAAFRRERRVLARVRRSRWRLEQAETERSGRWPSRARRIDDLQGAAVKDNPRAGRRRRLAEPDLTFAEFCDRTGIPWRSTHHGEQAWTSYQIERYRRGEIDQDPSEAYNPLGSP